MPYVYRCNACRTRNTFLKPWLDYVKGRACRHCSHTRFYVDKERAGRLACRCGGYHYPHRPGSGACETSPSHDVHMAIRGGNQREIADAIFERNYARKDVTPPPGVIPF